MPLQISIIFGKGHPPLQGKKAGVNNFLRTIGPKINQACCKSSLENKDTILLK